MAGLWPDEMDDWGRDGHRRKGTLLPMPGACLRRLPLGSRGFELPRARGRFTFPTSKRGASKP